MFRRFTTIPCSSLIKQDPTRDPSEHIHHPNLMRQNRFRGKMERMQHCGQTIFEGRGGNDGSGGVVISFGYEAAYENEVAP